MAVSAVQLERLQEKLTCITQLTVSSRGADVYFRGGVNTNSYLYIESESGKSVSILDVTEPSRYTAVGSVDLPSAKGPYAFVRALNSRDAHSL